MADVRGSAEPQADEITALRILRQLSSDALAATDMRTLLEGLLDKWIALHRADFGNIQLYDREKRILRIAAQRGFEARFLDYFAEVDAEEASACGMALKSGSAVIIEDVETDPAYAPSLVEARTAGYRSVQSTPLLTQDRHPLAMVSTHFRERRHFDERELRFTELAARQTADAIRAQLLHDELEASRERLRRVLETDAIGVIFLDQVKGTVVGANDVFLRMTGYSREQVKARSLTWRDMTPPEWIRASEEQMTRLEQTGHLGPYEKEYVLKDGSKAWMMFAGRSLGDGTAVEYCVDISARKRAEAERELLARELAHRVKNTLAVVQALATQTAHGATSVDAFQTAFLGRLQALSAAHSRLIDAQWRSTELRAVVERAIAPFRTDHDQRIEIGGPSTMVSAKQAVGIGLILHELGTNAVKYGALSTKGGRLNILWERKAVVGASQLHLEWRESDGPKVGSPGRKGFGTKFIEHTSRYDLDGEVTMSYAPEGFSCTVLVPSA